MKAVCWYGKHDVRLKKVPDPILIDSRDAIVRVTASTICGSDLHIYDGYIPSMIPGDVIGHEFMGEVVEVGEEVKNLKPGDRVSVSPAISCGSCWFCKNGEFSLCDNSNPNAHLIEPLYNQSPAAFYGYSHLFGGVAGAFAEYVRVPFADVGAIKVPENVPDEKALFVSDAMPTGYQAAEFCNIRPGQVVAVWGCGAVGLMAMQSAYAMGAGRVIAIDRLPYRLQAAREKAGAETLNFEEVNILEALKEMTGGRGPDACIDAVGMEADASGVEDAYDKVKQKARLETERPHVVREAILACRKGGTVSIAGVYVFLADKFPLGAVFNKGLTLRAGQVHAPRYMPKLLGMIQEGKIDPSFLVTHRLRLEQAPRAFEMFRKKEDNCLRVLFGDGAMAA
jgi:threonine dehydrogenase-like Zn-dependent dehydrogenase